MRIVRARAEFLRARAELATAPALVPTMGALHAGHRALLDSARAEADVVVATIFVNPLQFGPSEDLARYPRPLDADLTMCEQAGVDLVWVPAVDDVYSRGQAQVTVSPGPLGEVLEGAVRPGHFAGVLTVVAKFFNLVRPSRAYFGEKDYQQLMLVRRMAADLDQPVDVRGVPTVRERDGLALSSRNVYLSTVDRQRATALSQALFAGRSGGLGEAQDILASAGVEPDYLELRGIDLGPVPATGSARMLVAARIGGTRLIDNVGVEL